MENGDNKIESSGLDTNKNAKMQFSPADPSLYQITITSTTDPELEPEIIGGMDEYCLMYSIPGLEAQSQLFLKGAMLQQSILRFVRLLGYTATNWLTNEDDTDVTIFNLTKLADALRDTLQGIGNRISEIAGKQLDGAKSSLSTPDQSANDVGNGTDHDLWH